MFVCVRYVVRCLLHFFIFIFYCAICSSGNSRSTIQGLRQADDQGSAKIMLTLHNALQLEQWGYKIREETMLKGGATTTTTTSDDDDDDDDDALEYRASLAHSLVRTAGVTC